ncbi:hypothetical protein CWI38_0032p0010, partial [Hamiltosporidium tvaerminnensis]
WKKSKEISTRRAAILKYRLVEEVTKKSLEESQLAKLFNEIEKRKLHSKLYNARKNELVSVSDSSRWLKRGNIRPRNEAVFCYIQDRNVFWGADGVCQHCGKSGKTVDHLATRCEKMLGHDYTRRHNEVVRCLHLFLLNRYKFESSKRIRSHSVQEILDNEYAEIRVDTRIKTDITLIEVGITSQESLQIVETEKLRKYNLLANELGLIYKFNVEIIPYGMTWDCITVETISFDRRRRLESELNAKRARRVQLTPSFKQVSREEDGAKHLKGKNDTPLISERGTTNKEPTININDESYLEEETKVVKTVEKII